jgi:Clostripain family
MKSIQNYALFLCICASFCYTSLYAVTKKPWTFCVYLAAANTLSEFAAVDINEMIKVGSNDTVNIIVYLTVFNADGSKSTQRLYIEKGKTVQIGQTATEDSGSVNTLMKALQWMCTDYPADHYCVVLWNHGSGVLNRNCREPLRGICYDDSTGSFLTDRDCLKAFSWAKSTLNNNKNIDIVATDACLMSMIEFAYALTPCTDYFVGSESTIPGDGYEYARILNSFTRGVPSAHSLAQTLVYVYQQVYDNTPDCELSAIKQAALAPLIHNVNQVATFLLDALNGSQKARVYQYITDACKGATSFAYPFYIDIANFYSLLSSYVHRMGLPSSQVATLQGLLAQGLSLINACVIAKMTSTSYKTLGGIAIYFPQQGIDTSYLDLYWTEHNPAVFNLLQVYSYL